MVKLICTRGMPNSGKTTWTQAQIAASAGSLIRLSREDLRSAMDSNDTAAIEHNVTIAHHAAIEGLLRSGKSVVVDDRNLDTTSLRQLAAVGWKCGADVVIKDFDVALEECLRRDAERAEPVGATIIRDLHARYFASGKQRPAIERPETVVGMPYVPNPSLPAVILVDIDGTVALRGERDPYDTSRYHEDTPNIPVIHAVQAMASAGFGVVFCSGRDVKFREVTEKWLAEHVRIPGAPLFMRPEGDLRRDDIIKLELFDTHMRNTYNVVCVFDDRDRVVAAWRAIGLTVCQVAEGMF